MKHYIDYADDRFKGFCVFCGGEPKTSDHNPSKAFLDKPYPLNLPVVSCCKTCNSGYSLDEQYVTCLFEVILCRLFNDGIVQRAKIQRALDRRPKILTRINSAYNELRRTGELPQDDFDRVLRIVIKLARGHAPFEQSLPQLQKPDRAFVTTSLMLDQNELAAFESTERFENILPEVGSRAFQRVILEPLDSLWVRVQRNNYRYFTTTSRGSLLVRIVIREFFYCEVEWI